MNDFVWLFVSVCTFFAGWKLRETAAVMYMNAVLRTQQQDAVHQDEDPRKKVGAKIEVIEDTYYVYSLETDEFLAQGNSFKELQDNLLVRFPDTIFLISREHLIKVSGFSDETI